MVEAVFGKELFDCAQGQQEGVKRKPDPAGIYRILEKLGVSVEDCVYVGDSEVDLETGKRAGVRTVSVGWGFRTGRNLRTQEPEGSWSGRKNCWNMRNRKKGGNAACTNMMKNA